MKPHRNPLFARATALIGLPLLFFVGGCAQTVNTHGQIILPSKLAQIKVNESSREDVLQLLGSPSSQGTLNGNRWYYVTSQMKNTTFRPNQLTDRRVLVIDFDPTTGKVSGLVQHTAADGKALEPAAKITPTQGQSMGIIEQFVGNLGNIGK